ncbi:MAG: DUF4919 domain-containing protein [Bacteroidales bacterium]|nr:DUF4919 domain-containing protein [Bacteroidales bacterium]
MKMRYLKSIVTVAFLSMVALFVMGSCSTSKKTTTLKGEASITANAPDYKRIKKEINTKESEFYYPELLRRFQAADTTLSLEQLRHFYYGTATRSDYDPYKRAKIDALREAFEKDTPSKEDWEKAAKEIDKELETDPTNIRFHWYKQIIYSNLYGPDSEKTADAYNQVVMLLSAVTSTGDGRSKETAFHVINVADEYGIMDICGLSPTMQSLVKDKGQSYDVMDLKENEYGLKSMYFNITVSMETTNKIFGF